MKRGVSWTAVLAVIGVGFCLLSTFFMPALVVPLAAASITLAVLSLKD